MKRIVSILTILAVSLNLAYAGTKSSKERDAGWYLRTVVTATTADGSVFTHETAGVFGLLRQSKNKKDRHDIAAYGESGAILQILFTPQDWGEDNGNYFSNYKHYNARKPYKRRVWEFKVRNPRSVNLANADLKIELKAPLKVMFRKEGGNVIYKEYPFENSQRLLSKLHLVDIDNQTTYSYDELKDLTLGMDGKHTRAFRWVLGKVKQADFAPLNE